MREKERVHIRFSDGVIIRDGFGIDLFMFINGKGGDRPGFWDCF